MELLKELRKKNNYTQVEIAKMLGISQQAYYLYEKENTIPNINVLNKLSEFYNVPIEIFTDKTKNNDLDDYSIEEFLAKSYTAYHATINSKVILESNGFKKLELNQKWKLEKGGKYYIMKNSSAMIAFRVGSLEHYAFNICGCHTDSPSLKIKGDSLIPSKEGKRINVEKYGGLILYSMMDIPLRIGGRLLIKDENKIVQKIVTSNFNVNIPSLCIHHNPTVNDNLTLNPQVDMLPLLSQDVESIYKLFTKKEVIDADLYVVPDVKPYYSGINQEFFVSPRLDNLTSVYSIINGLINSEPDGISLAYLTDNEEIGSLTKQGAESEFIKDILMNINESLGYDRLSYNTAITNGFILSIDNGHAIHPAHPEKADPDHICIMNEGIMIKHHTNYSTDGLSSSIVKTICKNNSIKYQDYYNRSDLRNGSTIGNILSAKLEMNSVDIGLAQLAMHSAIETVGKKDIQRMIDLVTSFYNTNITFIDSDTYNID